MTIATSLRAKQKQLKLSTFALAKRLRISYISVRKVLEGVSRPNRATIAKYAKFLELGPKQLAGRLAGAKPAKAAKPAGRRTAAKRKAVARSATPRAASKRGGKRRQARTAAAA